MNFSRITTTNDKNFHKTWNLYEKSFPIYERRTLDTHIKALNDENFYCTYITENNTFIGILFYWKLEEFIYIEHLAIDETLRGQGYGSKILKEFSSIEKNLILEIDPPIDDVSIKRYHFYENAGFKLYDFEHIQLPYRKGYEGYKLKILAKGINLSQESYSKFYELMFKNLLPYCQN